LSVPGQYPPPDFAVSGKNLFFDGYDPTHGFELWKADLTGSISGSVFNDANHNGVRDPGEGGMPGVTVFLDANNNGHLDPGEVTAATDSDGNYVFSAVPGGVPYSVREVLQSAYRRTAPL